jgi:Arc/MetJ-type ribon-helix-helix transcriptional regulator
MNTICVDGERMVRMSESEKITINLSVVDLGKIDLLVSEGFYANRTDLIRTAIRNQLNQHSEAVEKVVVRRTIAMRILVLGKADLEKKIAKGERLSVRLAGLLVINNDVAPELADAAIESIQVYGAFRANKAIKTILADRTS